MNRLLPRAKSKRPDADDRLARAGPRSTFGASETGLFLGELLLNRRLAMANKKQNQNPNRSPPNKTRRRPRKREHLIGPAHRCRSVSSIKLCLGSVLPANAISARVNQSNHRHRSQASQDRRWNAEVRKRIR